MEKQSSSVQLQLTPGHVLRCVMPVATMLVRVNQGEGKGQGALKEMLNHCQALADALPIEFAFRSMEADSNDNKYEFLETLFNRIGKVKVDWSALCSQVAIQILSNSIEITGNLPATALQERLHLMVEAYRKTSDSEAITISHPAFSETIRLGNYATKDEFWETVFRLGASFSVDPYASDEASITKKNIFPEVGKTVIINLTLNNRLHTYNITTKNILFHESKMLYEIQIVNDALEINRTLHHLTMSWGANSIDRMKEDSDDALLPSAEDLRVIIHHIVKHMKRPAFRSLGFQASVILVSQPTGRSFLRAGLFAFCFAGKNGIDATTSSQREKLWANLWGNALRQGLLAELPTFPKEYENFAATVLSPCNQIDKTLAMIGGFADLLIEEMGSLVSQDSSSDDPRDPAAVLKLWLQQMKTNYDVVLSPAICGHAVTMMVPSASHSDLSVPFLELVPRLLTADEVNPPEEGVTDEFLKDLKMKLVARAQESIARGRYLTTMLEDAMTFGTRMLEAEQESTFNVICKGAFGTARAVALIPWALGQVVKSAVSPEQGHLVKARQEYVDALFHKVWFTELNLSQYGDVVKLICARLNNEPPCHGQEVCDLTASWSLVQREESIAQIPEILPEEIKTMSLRELVDNRSRLFTNPKVSKLFQGRSYGLMIFFLKTIYHCYHLRRLRKEITLVTIAGEKNAGKTTLNLEIFGPEVVTAQTGTGSAETTIYPSAYSHPTLSDVIFCDLPGSSDQDTAEMSDIFFSLGDIAVYVILQSTAPSPRDTDLLYTRIEQFMKINGPRLICVNQADALLKRQRHSKVPYDPEAKLKSECELWATSALFGKHLQGHADLRAPKWECEKVEQAGAIIASVRTADSALSIWMTSFEPIIEVDTAERLLFGAPHVKAWVDEARGMLRNCSAIHQLE